MSIWTPTTKKALAGPLDPKHVSERSQAGRTLSYIEGWHAITEANRIFGFDGWVRETISMDCVHSGKNAKGNDACTYVAKVRITAGDIVREGTGAGHGFSKQPGDAHESAVKEAETDAMKRALMTFGNKFGLALYDKTQANVRVDDGRLSNAKARPVAEKINKDIDGSQTVEELDAKWKIIQEDGIDTVAAGWGDPLVAKYESKRETLKDNQV